MSSEGGEGRKTDLVACKYLVMNDKYKNLNVIFLPFQFASGKAFNMKLLPHTSRIAAQNGSDSFSI